MGIIQLQTVGEVAGRLEYHKSNWRLLTKDCWVLSMVEGYTINFHSIPVQSRMRTPPIFNQEQFSLVQHEIQEVVRKHALSEVMD